MHNKCDEKNICIFSCCNKISYKIKNDFRINYFPLRFFIPDQNSE